MSLRIKLWIWAAAIYIAIGFMAFQLLAVSKWYFIAAEGIVLLSFFVFVWLQHSLLKPIKAISNGAKILEEQDFNTRLVPVGNKEIDKLITVYNRMVDALRHERIRQEETHSFLSKLIEASPQGIIILDFDSNITELNPAALRIIGISRDEAIGKNINEFPNPWAETLLEANEINPHITRMMGGRSFRIERATFIDKGFNRQFFIVDEQTNEIINLERQAYEKIIRMMAHEVNNSTGAINSMLSSLISYTDQLASEDRADYNSALEVSIDRNRSLSMFMSNLSSVVKLPKVQLTDVDIIPLVSSVLRVMSQKFKENSICVETSFPATPLLVAIDQTQMEQVLVNILKNAIEAIGTDGKIEVCIYQNTKSITIRNNGAPIPADVQKKLFTPFFSTKKNGQGVGLMLIREVLTNHGFAFNLETNPNGSTEFTVWF